MLAPNTVLLTVHYRVTLFGRAMFAASRMFERLGMVKQFDWLAVRLIGDWNHRCFRVDFMETK